MSRLTNDFLTEITTDDFEQPRLSLYQSTHRRHPENQQDPIRFRGLVNHLKQLLLKNHPPAQVSALLEPFEVLARDTEFWNHTLDGLAVFAAPGWFRVIGLRRTVQELTVVADSFHTKPLRRILQTADRYQVLGLNLHEIKLYEGEIVGHIIEGSGNLRLGTIDNPQSDDLLDDLGERVLENGGKVFVVPAVQMPTDTGAAATCRY